jgi:hypothetical protein
VAVSLTFDNRAHYMLSKCLWKMFSCDDTVRGSSPRISVDSVLDSLLDTIDALPQRNSRSEQIFEPHYKLVSVVNKLVRREVLMVRISPPNRSCDLLMSVAGGSK